MNKILVNWLDRYFSNPEAIALVAILFGALSAFKIFGSVIAPVTVAIIVAYLLFGLVKKLQKIHVNFIAAVSIVFILFLGVIVWLFLWALPILWEQLIRLTQELPKIFNHSQHFLNGLYARYPDIFSTEYVARLSGHVANFSSDFGHSLLSFSLASIIGVITLSVYLVLGPLLVFFFLRDGSMIALWLKKFLPKERAVLREIWHDIKNKIACYVRGKIIEMTIVAVITILSFWVLHLHYAFLLGFLVGVSVIIPYLGVVLVTIPVAIIGLLAWGFSAHFWYLMLVYALINVLDANVLVPLLYSEVMDLHPVAVILAVLIFGCLAGFWGIFFAIPLMTTLHILMKRWPVKNDNG